MVLETAVGSSDRGDAAPRSRRISSLALSSTISAPLLSVPVLFMRADDGPENCFCATGKGDREGLPFPHFSVWLGTPFAQTNDVRPTLSDNGPQAA